MDNTTSPQADATERTRPKPLSRNSTDAMKDMLQRILPDAVPDDGVAKLDVCGFQSSI